MFKFTILLLCFPLIPLISQVPYFQQDLAYRIKVELDDQKHILTGFIEIKYKNNSPHILDKIGFHLWPNAYKHKSTAFAKQKVRMGDLSFHRAADSAFGSIDKMDFKVDGQQIQIQFEPKSDDMAWLVLNQPLQPNQSIEITSPFQVQIPENFSRMGRGPESYQITQWYPKPAVYDHKGWHLMPYLDYGEYYSEFGSFDVEISLPEDYVVAATGTLMSAEELNFLDLKVKWTKNIIENKTDQPASPLTDHPKMKTIRYVADSIHDFAWFADKKFLVQKSQVDLGNGKKVDTWTFFKSKELWKDAIYFVNRSVGYFSSLIGDYPWPQATAVESELHAGGGMEYPMITVIGSMYNSAQLDEVIAHEVAHNWFYGILAFNEREHPFLDEGITTYCEKRYMKKYYEEGEWIPSDSWLSRLFKNVHPEKFQYLLFSRNYQDQYPNQNADHFSELNYGNDVYEKSSQLLTYVESWLGREKLDALLSSFYQKWKFKHPYPEDFELHVQDNIAKNANWLFKGFFSSNGKMDYRMQSLQKDKDSVTLKIKNCAQVPAPFILSGIRNDEPIERQWMDGFTGTKSIRSACRDCDYFAIDIDQESFDLYESNNYIKTKGLFKKIEKINVRLLPIIDKPRTTDIGITPVVNINQYDGISPGFYISGPWLPFRKFNMHLTPLYGFQSKKLNGSAGISYHWFLPDSKMHQLQFDFAFKKYSYAKSKQEIVLDYVQFKPSVTCFFYHLPSHQLQSHLRYTLFAERNAYLNFSDTLSPGYQKAHLNTFTHVIDYSRLKTSVLGNFSIDLRLMYFNQSIIHPLKQHFLRTDITLQKSFLIADKRYANIRSYISFFPIHSERNSTSISSRSSPFYYRGSTGLTFQNYQDELNEFYFYGRTEQRGFASQQIQLLQGGFKLPLGSACKEQIGNSNSFTAAINFSTDLPIPFIGSYFKPYFDLGYFESPTIAADGNWLWSSGIQLQLMPDILSIYFPIAHSGNIRDVLNAKTRNQYLKQISFTLNVPFSSDYLLQKIFKY